MQEYLTYLSASQEVVDWVSTTLGTARKKYAISQDQIEHVLDYLTSDKAPKRLRKMSYTQAKQGADKWSKSQQKKGRNLKDDPEDIEIIYSFSNGTAIVKLRTSKAYKREGYLMSHCVGGYSPDSLTVYSYRDEKNMPHATFEVSSDNEEILQIKGKGNGDIHPKYIEPILEFMRSIDMTVKPHDMKNLGYHVTSPDTKELLSNFVCEKGNPPKYVKLSGVEYLVAGT